MNNTNTNSHSLPVCAIFFRCVGSTQHLKDRHGSGYILEVKLQPQAAQPSHATEFSQAVEQLFPGAKMVETFGERITFKISQDSVGALSRVFAWFEEGNTMRFEMRIGDVVILREQGGIIMF